MFEAENELIDREIDVINSSYTRPNYTFGQASLSLTHSASKRSKGAVAGLLTAPAPNQNEERAENFRGQNGEALKQMESLMKVLEGGDSDDENNPYLQPQEQQDTSDDEEEPLPLSPLPPRKSLAERMKGIYIVLI